jgi:hypothetical protein
MGQLCGMLSLVNQGERPARPFLVVARDGRRGGDTAVPCDLAIFLL